MSAGAFVVALAVVLASASAWAQTVTFARGPDDVVVTMTEILGEVGGADRGPTLTIHGDGRAEVRFPAYMKRAGRYTLQLRPAELEGLVRSLVTRGLLTFDVAAVRARTRAAAAARRAAEPARRTIVMDDDTIVVELRANGVERRIAWSGLRSDTAAYPDVPALQNLATAHRELRAVMDRPDLRKVE